MVEEGGGLLRILFLKETFFCTGGGTGAVLREMCGSHHFCRFSKRELRVFFVPGGTGAERLFFSKNFL